MTERQHYQTEEDAGYGLQDMREALGWTIHKYIDGILTVAVPDNSSMHPVILLRENEGLYWQEPDA